jgi:uncharacterized protein YhhL (DUF1145 family)
MLIGILLIYLLIVSFAHILWISSGIKSNNYFMTTWLSPCWIIIFGIYAAKAIWRAFINGCRIFWNELVKAIRS